MTMEPQNPLALYAQPWGEYIDDTERWRRASIFSSTHAVVYVQPQNSREVRYVGVVVGPAHFPASNAWGDVFVINVNPGIMEIDELHVVPLKHITRIEDWPFDEPDALLPGKDESYTIQ